MRIEIKFNRLEKRILQIICRTHIVKGSIKKLAPGRLDYIPAVCGGVWRVIGSLFRDRGINHVNIARNDLPCFKCSKLKR